MATVLELTRTNKCAGEIGLEIEVEGTNLPRALSNLWRVDKDGSLRGESFEYVLAKPLSVNMVQKALNHLEEAYKHCGSVVNNSVRAGIHVHINVQEMTLMQLWTFITLYYTLEGMLVKWCGKEREGNFFCLRCQDAEAVLFYLSRAIKTGKLNAIATDEIRYASLNLNAVVKYGSVEFRSMRSTTDFKSVMDWVCVLKRIKDQSLKFNTPLEVVDACLSDMEKFPKKILGNLYNTFKNEEEQKLLNSGVRYANDVAHMADWKKYGEKKEVKQEEVPLRALEREQHIREMMAAVEAERQQEI